MAKRWRTGWWVACVATIWLAEAAAAAEAAAPWEQETRERLATQVEVEFRETPMAEACRQLARKVDIPIFVEPELAKSAPPITLAKLRGAAETLVRGIAVFSGGAYAVCDDAVVIGRDAKSLAVTRVYEPLRRPGPRFQFQRVTGLAGMLQEEEGRAAEGVGWVAFVRAAVTPETWRPLKPAYDLPAWPPYHVRYRDGSLLVTHRQEVQDQVERVLAEIGKKPNEQIHIAARIIEINEEHLKALKGELGLEAVEPGRGRSATCAPLAAERATKLLEAVLKEKKGTVLLAPRLTCFNTQRASFRPVVNYGYVRRIGSDEEPTPTLLDEMTFHVQPFFRPKQNEIVLFIVLMWPGSWAISESPRLRTFTVTVPDGGTVLLTGFTTRSREKGSKKDTAVIMLLTAQSVPDIFEEE